MINNDDNTPLLGRGRGRLYYLPPISWFSDLLQSGEPLTLDFDERWQKQSLRNRCYIDSPNGKLALSIPIDKSTIHGPIRDVKLSRQLNWQHQHWQAFETTYYNSPFFEYLQDDFRPVYQKEWTYLADLNETLIHTCLNLLEIDPSNPLLPPLGGGLGRGYYQVFQSKHGFLPDLSIIDLLFNMGNESILYL